jgi:hypothetical protein
MRQVVRLIKLRKITSRWFKFGFRRSSVHDTIWSFCRRRNYGHLICMSVQNVCT